MSNQVAHTAPKFQVADLEAFKIEARAHLERTYGPVKSIKFTEDEHVYTAHATLKAGK